MKENQSFPINALYIGYQKTGSTFLRHYLYAHPEVDLQRTGEFLQTPEADPARGIEHVLEAYKAHFPMHDKKLSMDMYEGLALGYYFTGTKGWTKETMMTRHARFGEDVCYSPQTFAARLAKLSNANLKIVITIRNQVDWIRSNYYHHRGYFQDQPHSLNNFFETIEGKIVLASAQFDTMVSIWRTHFGKDNVLVLPLEFIHQQEEAALTQLCSFLDISYTKYAKEDRRYNKGTEPKSNTLSLKRTLAKIFRTEEKKFAPLSEKQINFIKYFYAANNANLSEMIGMDLSELNYYL